MLTADPRLLRALAELRAKGLKLGVASNCAVEEVAAWNDSPFAPLFDQVVFSYRVGFSKPDPRIYRLACQGLGVSPSKVIFVGDGGSDELAGARAVGMTAYRARWFLDQWPAAHRDHRSDQGEGFPALFVPDELVALLLDHR